MNIHQDLEMTAGYRQWMAEEMLLVNSQLFLRDRPGAYALAVERLHKAIRGYAKAMGYPSISED